MKILFATMQFGHGYTQGTERYLTVLAEGLRRRGHDTIFLAGDPERRGRQRLLGQTVNSSPRVLFYPTRGRFTVEGLPPRDLRTLLARERPELVHVANPAHIGIGLLRAANELGIPTVVTVVDYWWLCPKHTLLHHRGSICNANVPWPECVRCIAAGDPRPSRRWLASLPVVNHTLLPLLSFGNAWLKGFPAAELWRWTRRQTVLLSALDGASAVIFLSVGARDRLAPRLKRVQTWLIPVGLEARWFQAARSREYHSWHGDPARLVLGFAGALARHKGPHLLLDALHRLGWTAARVRIAGSGSDPDYVDELRARAAGLNVEFLGSVPSAEMPAFLAGLDLLVVPSIWPENQPQAVLEALATGTPVLASRVDGISELISDPEMLFEMNSPSSLAARLDQWLKRPRATPAAGKVNGAEDMVAQTLVVYTRIRNSCGNQPPTPAGRTRLDNCE